MAFRPFSWLKNTKSDQCASHVRCVSAPSGLAPIFASMISFSRVMSSAASSQSCIRMSAANLPHSALTERSAEAHSER